MGAVFEHKCNSCGYSVSTSGPWEFYRKKNGRMEPYGHPVPVSKEAQERGIYGLYGNLYCPICDATHEIILVEFKEPCRRSIQAWGGEFEPKDEYKKKDVVKCPSCDNTELVLYPEAEKQLVCQHCRIGVMVGSMRFIC